jgi:hypothetical protein
MGAITSYAQLTLMEAMKREHYDDLAASLGELAQMIDVLDVMPWKPSTHGTYNKQFQASRLGSGGFGKTNAAISTISSSGELIEEPVKIYEGLSTVDERILQGVDDPAAVRDSEDGLNMEGAFQDWAYNLFYGTDGTAPDNFYSFASRRPAKTGYTPYVVDAGGSTALTSAWLLELSPETLYLAYPANSGTPGFKNEDRGRLPLASPATSSGTYFAWTRLYQIWAAIVLRNARALIRYCNIESAGASKVFVIKDFVRYCKAQLQNMGRNSFIFVNRYVKGQIESGAYSDTMNGALTVQAIEGYGPVTFVAGIPLRMHEGITNAETALT